MQNYCPTPSNQSVMFMVRTRLTVSRKNGPIKMAIAFQSSSTIKKIVWYIHLAHQIEPEHVRNEDENQDKLTGE